MNITKDREYDINYAANTNFGISGISANATMIKSAKV